MIEENKADSEISPKSAAVYDGASGNTGRASMRDERSARDPGSMPGNGNGHVAAEAKPEDPAVTHIVKALVAAKDEGKLGSALDVFKAAIKEFAIVREGESTGGNIVLTSNGKGNAEKLRQVLKALHLYEDPEIVFRQPDRYVISKGKIEDALSSLHQEAVASNDPESAIRIAIQRIPERIAEGARRRDARAFDDEVVFFLDDHPDPKPAAGTAPDSITGNANKREISNRRAD